MFLWGITCALVRRNVPVRWNARANNKSTETDRGTITFWTFRSRAILSNLCSTVRETPPPHPPHPRYQLA
jgi:hypothetical protein